jgi:uncharacterized protein YcfL
MKKLLMACLVSTLVFSSAIIFTGCEGTDAIEDVTGIDVAPIKSSSSVDITNEQFYYSSSYGGTDTWQYTADVKNNNSKECSVTYDVYALDSTGNQINSATVWQSAVLPNTKTTVGCLINVPTGTTPTYKRGKVNVYGN